MPASAWDHAVVGLSGRARPPPLSGHWSLHASDTYGGDPFTVPAPAVLPRCAGRTVPVSPLPRPRASWWGVDAPHRLFFREEEESKGCSHTRQRVSGAGGRPERWWAARRPLALLGWGLPRGCLHDNV